MNIRKIVRRAIVRISPRMLLTLRFLKNFHRLPDVKSPKTFSERILWRLLYDHNDLYTKAADKVLVREYIKERIGPSADKYFPDCYGVYDSVEEIDFEKLPNQFVLKPNHASGFYHIVQNKDELNIPEVKNEMRSWMQVNWYYEHAEWQYKNIVPKIICEELLTDEIADYRYFCFRGKIAFIRVTVHSKESKTGFAVGVYDEEWNPCECHQDDDIRISVQKPAALEEMNELARSLAKEFDFVRVDLYYVAGKPFFSELTFSPNGGFYHFKPEKWETILGDMWGNHEQNN